MFLVTSNPRKRREYARFGLDLDIRPGEDLPEVHGTPAEVAIHKAKAVGTGAVVEDTVIIVDGHPWVDIKWAKQHLKEFEGSRVQWQVTLAHNDGEKIDLFVGSISGVLIYPETVRPESFGFDAYFIPDGFDCTLDELELAGRKDEVSARKIATQKLLNRTPDQSVEVGAVEEWAGEWQGQQRAQAIRRPRMK